MFQNEEADVLREMKTIRFSGVTGASPGASCRARLPDEKGTETLACSMRSKREKWIVWWCISAHIGSQTVPQ
jgi:hypothetical protein